MKNWTPVIGLILGVLGGAMVYWGCFWWWAESDSPWFRAAPDYQFRHLRDASLFVGPGAILIAVALILGAVAFLRRKNSN